jgi:hypothetical protein
MGLLTRTVYALVAPGGLTLNEENYIDIIDKTAHRLAAAGRGR